MESRTTSASLPQGGQAVNRPQLALRVAGSGLHHIHWTNAPVEGRKWTIERDFATIWGLDDDLRGLLSQMLAGPALYEAAKALWDGKINSRADWLLVLGNALRAAETLVIEGEVGNG